MRLKCMHAIAMLGIVFCLPYSAFAKVWRINNNAGVSTDFTNVNTAISHVTVQNGDTLYVEPSAASYNGGNLNKRLVIIGAGYFLSENTGLQASTNDSFIGSFTLDSLCSGSVIMGIRLSQVFVNSAVDNMIWTRCAVSFTTNNSTPNSRLSNWVINKCHLNSFSFSSTAYFFENLQITNCIVTGTINTAASLNGLIRNNVIGNGVDLVNTYVSNNIFTGAGTNSFVNCTVKHNIATSANGLPAGNNNQNGVAATTIFVTGGTTDGRWRLRAGSPAIAAGETISGVTPDLGAYGTDDPYRISGIPPIPAIYSLTVPSSIPSTATSMNITVSTRSNN